MISFNPLIILIDLILVLIPLIYFKYKKKSFLEATGIKRIKLKELLKKSFFLLGLLILTFFVVNTISNFFGVNDLSKVFEVIKSLSIISIFYLLIVRVAAEEIFFRGFLTTKTGIIISSIVFALMHTTYNSIIEVIGVFLLGLILAVQFKKNNNLFPNIVAHFLYNLIIIIIIFNSMI